MDREVLKLTAHIDQTRADVQTALQRMQPDDLVELFRDCASGRLTGMDEQQQQLVGMLAAMAIYDCCQSREEPPSQVCPQCGEDNIDQLQWLADERVRCARCGTVYDPSRADE